MTETTHDLSTIIKAYDVRGRAGEDLTEEVARALGAAFSDQLDAAAIIVAHDMRVSSPQLSTAFIDGAVRRGSTVARAGLSSTDQLYCASGLHRAAGAMFTASHNPPADNGIKLCLPGARPISRDSGLDDIRRRAEAYLDAGEIPERPGGRAEDIDTLADYVDTVLSLVSVPSRRRLRVVVDAGNAMAGLTMPAVAERLDAVDVIPLYFELDGTFPHHQANPLAPATLTDLQARVQADGADLGLAFDGDADRCIAVDEAGRIVPPSALTALIAAREIDRVRADGELEPAVVANLVSSRHVEDAIRAAGGRRIRSRVGHSLIKALMAEHDAVFGGEHSAHYYFRDFFYADSGMLAALHLLAALATTDGPLSALIAQHDPYASSGEINSRVPDGAAAIQRVQQWAARIGDVSSDQLDGLTLEHWAEDEAPREQWWLSLRASNTEPLLRLNVEAAEHATMERIRDEVLEIVRSEVPAESSGADIPSWLRAALRCPACRAELRDRTGALECTDCGSRYAVREGIAMLTEPDE